MQIRSERTVAEARDEHVTVRKSVLDLGREHVSGIRLHCYTVSREPVSVRLVEAFPGHVSMADVQVHPDYDADRWTVSEQLHRMEFEAELPAGGEVETIYGVRVNRGEGLEPFLEAPVIEGSEVVGGEPGQAPADDPSSTSGPEGAGAEPADASLTGDGDDPPGAINESVVRDAPADDGTSEPEPSADDGAPGRTPPAAEADRSAGRSPPADASADEDQVSEPTGSVPPTPDEAGSPGDEVAASTPEAGPSVVPGEAAHERGPDEDARSAPDDDRREAGVDPSTIPDGDTLPVSGGLPDPDALRADPAPAEPTEGDRSATGAFEFGEDRARAGVSEGAGELDDTDLTAADPPIAGSGAPVGATVAVETFVDRLAEAELTDAQRDAVRDVLGLAPDASWRRQLDHLQRSVTRLDAFADEFEAFVDAVGAPADAIDQLRADHDRLAGVVESLSGVARSAVEEHDELRAALDRVERQLESLREDHGADVDALDARVGELEETFGADEVDAVREVLAAEQAWRRHHEASQARPSVPATLGASDS